MLLSTEKHPLHAIDVKTINVLKLFKDAQNGTDIKIRNKSNTDTTF